MPFVAGHDLSLARPNPPPNPDHCGVASDCSGLNVRWCPLQPAKQPSSAVTADNIRGIVIVAYVPGAEMISGCISRFARVASV